MQTELREVAADLWVWRVEHPAWQPGFDWGPLVASTCVEPGGKTVVLDPRSASFRTGTGARPRRLRARPRAPPLGRSSAATCRCGH